MSERGESARILVARSCLEAARKLATGTEVESSARTTGNSGGSLPAEFQRPGWHRPPTPEGTPMTDRMVYRRRFPPTTSREIEHRMTGGAAARSRLPRFHLQ